MSKINLPVDGTNITPNPNNMTGEATEYQRLQMLFPRSTTGQITFTASPSGITYNTADYTTDVNIYNKGETGMMNLLYKLYGGANNGWIIDASDVGATVEGTGYFKAPNGTLICWGLYLLTLGSFVASGSMYHFSVTGLSITFPVAFSASPEVFINSAAISDTNYVCGLECYKTETNITGFFGLATTNVSVNMPVEWVAIGKWK
jgi:hypothetical protein